MILAISSRTSSSVFAERLQLATLVQLIRGRVNPVLRRGVESDRESYPNGSSSASMGKGDGDLQGDIDNIRRRLDFCAGV